MNGKLELPYKLMDIETDDERFTLSFKSFRAHQDSFSIKRSGLAGDFEVYYKCSGMENRFECDLTAANLYYFYYELDNAWDGLPGTKPVAILESNSETQERTKMTFRLDKGICFINGFFKNRDNIYKSGIIFDIEIDCIFIPEILASLENFFKGLEEIQGHRNFL